MSEPPSEQPPPPEPLPPEFAHRPIVNYVLVAACVVLALLTSLGNNEARLLPLFISVWPASSPDALTEVRHGEIWRLFTPAFIHFGIVHLILNMLAMVNLGGVLEQVQGSRFYLAFTATVALCSNLAQYAVGGSPDFGGMSGVIFGLFGFLWLRAWVDRDYILALNQSGIITTLLWFGFCFTGVMPIHIANTAHAVGLGIGAAWGVLSGLAARRHAAATAPATR